VWSREGKGGFASKSEKKRWLQNGAVLVNGKLAKLNDFIEFPVHSIVLFPKSKGRVTLC
jgi:16S rRNA U516 pseudouridylate synthase RsuA-like enzyme